MKKKFFLIDVLVYRPVLGFGFNYEPSTDTTEKIRNAMVNSMHGIIGPSEDEKTFCGHMHDISGDSEITNFKISDTKLSFTKQYKGRSSVNYLFTKKDGEVWLGEWEIKNGAGGDSKCVVVPINESFLEPEKEFS